MAEVWWITESMAPISSVQLRIEQGLSILPSTDPAEVSYFRSRGYSITFVPGVRDRMADTTALGVVSQGGPQPTNRLFYDSPKALTFLTFVLKRSEIAQEIQSSSVSTFALEL